MQVPIIRKGVGMRPGKVVKMQRQHLVGCEEGVSRRYRQDSSFDLG